MVNNLLNKISGKNYELNSKRTRIDLMSLFAFLFLMYNVSANDVDFTKLNEHTNTSDKDKISNTDNSGLDTSKSLKVTYPLKSMQTEDEKLNPDYQKQFLQSLEDKSFKTKIINNSTNNLDLVILEMYDNLLFSYNYKSELLTVRKLDYSEKTIKNVLLEKVEYKQDLENLSAESLELIISSEVSYINNALKNEELIIKNKNSNDLYESINFSLGKTKYNIRFDKNTEIYWLSFEKENKEIETRVDKELGNSITNYNN